MSEEREPTQTTPKGETIPIPKREDVLDALRKAAKVSAESQCETDDTERPA